MKNLLTFLPTWAIALSLISLVSVLVLGVYQGGQASRLYQSWVVSPPELNPLVGGSAEMDFLQTQVALEQEKVDLAEAEAALMALLSNPGLDVNLRGQIRYQLSTVEVQIANSSKDLDQAFEKITAAMLGYQDAMRWLGERDPLYPKAQTAWIQIWLVHKQLKARVAEQEFLKLAKLPPAQLLEELEKTTLDSHDVQAKAHAKERQGWIIQLIDKKTQNYPFFTKAPQP